MRDRYIVFYLFQFFLLFIWTSSSYGEGKTFLEINHPHSGQKILYQAEIDSKCHFNEKPLHIHKQSSQYEELNLLENIYFRVDQEWSSPKQKIWTLGSLKQVKFLVNLKEDKDCLFSTQFEIDGLRYDLKHITVEYKKALGLTLLSKVMIQGQSLDNQQEAQFTYSSLDAKGYFALTEFKLGLALNTHSNIRPHDQRKYASHHPTLEPLPLFLFRFGPFFINKDGAGFLIFPSEYFVLLATFLREGEPYQREGIGKRRESFYGGPLIKVKWLEFLYYQDLQDIHQGRVVKISLVPELEMNQTWTFTPKLSMQYWNDQYVQYFFGVNTQEAATAGRAFQGRGALNYEVMIQNTFRRGKWSFLFFTGMKFYGSAVYHSPIMARKREGRFITGLVYQLF
jgi:hypothetical protein